MVDKEKRDGDNQSSIEILHTQKEYVARKLTTADIESGRVDSGCVEGLSPNIDCERM
jgi:uncharacterized protein YeeX (DUF496 family)